jgi:hypothetical protein
MNERQLAFSLLALTFAAHLGCSPAPTIRETAKVSGHVTYDGKPVLQGQVLMYIEGGWFGTATISQGEYLMSDAPVGPVQVVISGSTVIRESNPAETEKKKWASIHEFQEQVKKLKAEGKNIEDLKSEPPPDDPNDIPSKYGGDRTTPLAREVKPGQQVIDLDIPKE